MSTCRYGSWLSSARYHGQHIGPLAPAEFKAWAIWEAQVRDRRLCNFKPEHQQLTVIPGRTPQWAFGTLPPYQVRALKTPINFRPPCPVFGFPAPKHPKNRTVPSKNNFRLNQPGISTKFGQSLVIITSNARSPPLNRNAMVLAAARC